MLTNKGFRASGLACAVFALITAIVVVGFSISFQSATAMLPQASADTHVAATSDVSSNNTVITLTANEKKAYRRAVAACMDYENQPNPIVVDMSDLKLTDKQAMNVGELLHGNGELFWINTYSDSNYDKNTFTLPCYYDDKKITVMRKKLDAAVAEAMKRVGPAMTMSDKVHMMHDYLIEHISYTRLGSGEVNPYTGLKEKDAFSGIVLGKADCFGYALSMDVLLRRCGFETDTVFNDKLDHAWNMVLIGSHWYHVDVTFDASFTGKTLGNYGTVFFDWSKHPCHLYLLQSDASMDSRTYDRDFPTLGVSIDSHSGWTCHHKATDATFDSKYIRGGDGSFNNHCNAYKNIVRTFNIAGIRYKVTSANNVDLAAVTGPAKKKQKALKIPETVAYKGVTYNVSGIKAGAFKNTNAKLLKVYSSKFTTSRVTGSLKGSKVAKVKLFDNALSRKVAYKKMFAKANSGKKIKLIA